MSHQYVTVQWTPYKRRYDFVLAVAVATYLATFFVIGTTFNRGQDAISPEILLMRATGTAAIILLHVTLSLGPLARLDRRFLPLMYNRRHLGVTTFALALVHAVVVTGFYHGFGVLSPFESLLTSNTQYRSISAFPFEILGVFALSILFVMAATSHDFWLKNLSPRVWKGIHMLVYVAWLAVVLHVALGALQSERSPIYPALLFVGVVWLAALHLIAGRREVRKDAAMDKSNDWMDAAAANEIAEGRGKVICIPGGERVAIFRHADGFSALTNVCAHQGGPLGEGRVIGGCITCPWHGFTYQPSDGCAPPPFSEKIATYALRIRDGRIFLNVNPHPPGTLVEPAIIEEEESAHAIAAG
jgi:nitrite reductase/ring-hydroxylating ferredoxin subunit/DMSO/TMAO reductase YedYZ heme-binding membrane subunit